MRDFMIESTLLYEPHVKKGSASNLPGEKSIVFNILAGK